MYKRSHDKIRENQRKKDGSKGRSKVYKKSLTGETYQKEDIEVGTNREN